MFKNHLWVSTYDNCLSGSGLSHSVWCFLTPSICLQISRCLYFFLLCSTPLCKCITFFFLIHSSVEGHLGCFQVLTMTNKAAMNIVEHMSLWHDWVYFGYIPKSGITGSWRRLFPNFLRNHHTDIQRDCTILHSHQQCRSVPFTPHPLHWCLQVDINVFDLGHSYMCRMESQSCFDLHFSDD